MSARTSALAPAAAHKDSGPPTGRPSIFELLDAAADFGRWLAEQDTTPPTHLPAKALRPTPAQEGAGDG